MPKLKDNQIPSYSRHRGSGQAVVTIDGRDIYLGKYNTVESRKQYNRIIGEWLAGGRQLQVVGEVTIVEIIDRFWKHASTYYVGPDGQPTSELETFRGLLRPLKEMYGSVAASDFGPLALKAFRAAMLKPRTVKTKEGKTIERPGWARGHLNKQMSRLKHVFKWAVGEQIIPAAVHQALLAVDGLRRGRSEARESVPVKPVPEAHVYAIKPHVSRQVWAMIELQLLTGARGGELAIMRPCDIDMGSTVWNYKPEHHKTEHHGHAREIRLGAAAQKVIEPFLAGRATMDYLFSPAEAEAERHATMHAVRKTPLSCGNVPGSNCKRKPKRRPDALYHHTSYARAIKRACVKAKTPHWHPHQLRHNAATRLRKDYGIEGAQVMLGQKTLSVTQVYAEKNAALAERIAAEVG